jgi:hypothetical protein
LIEIKIILSQVVMNFNPGKVLDSLEYSAHSITSVKGMARVELIPVDAKD